MRLTTQPIPPGSEVLRLHPGEIDAATGRGPWTAAALLCPVGAGVAELRAAHRLGDPCVPWAQALPLLLELVRARGYVELRCESSRLWAGFEWAADVGPGWQRMRIT